MNAVQDYLTRYTEGFKSLGYPALTETFVLRNGKPGVVGKRVGCRGTPKQCFSNAARWALRSGRGTYTEGYAMRHGWPIAIAHAWVTLDGKVMDNTLDAAEFDYMGVEIETKVLTQQLAKNKVYGLFDDGRGINVNLLFALDPGLKAACGLKEDA